MPDIEQLLDHLSAQLAELKTTDLDTRTPSRFVGQGASREFIEAVANNTVTTVPTTVREDRAAPGIASYLTKALAEGTGNSGGYLVPVQIAGEVLTMLRAPSLFRAHRAHERDRFASWPRPGPNRSLSPCTALAGVVMRS